MNLIDGNYFLGVLCDTRTKSYFDEFDDLTEKLTKVVNKSRVKDSIGMSLEGYYLYFNVDEKDNTCRIIFEHDNIEILKFFYNLKTKQKINKYHSSSNDDIFALQDEKNVIIFLRFLKKVLTRTIMEVEKEFEGYASSNEKRDSFLKSLTEELKDESLNKALKEFFSTPKKETVLSVKLSSLDSNDIKVLADSIKEVSYKNPEYITAILSAIETYHQKILPKYLHNISKTIPPVPSAKSDESEFV